MTTVLIGYDLAPGLTPAEYDRWLYDVHLPDLLANPHLKRIVLNRVLEPVATTSDGSTALTQAVTLYRVAELHFEDVDGFRLYREWFNAHPIPQERGPAGRTDFKFYVLCDAETFTRGRPGRGSTHSLQRDAGSGPRRPAGPAGASHRQSRACACSLRLSTRGAHCV